MVVERAGVVVLVPPTAPITGLMESDVAPLVLQDKVEVPFTAMTPGEAVKEVMEGRTPLKVVLEAMLELAETFPTLSCAVR